MVSIITLLRRIPKIVISYIKNPELVLNQFEACLGVPYPEGLKSSEASRFALASSDFSLPSPFGGERPRNTREKGSKKGMEIKYSLVLSMRLNVNGITY